MQLKLFASETLKPKCDSVIGQDTVAPVSRTKFTTNHLKWQIVYGIGISRGQVGVRGQQHIIKSIG
jgi:SRSO17 transposase